MRGRGQKIKSSIPPLASPVLEAGFLDFVEDMKATDRPRLPASTGKEGVELADMSDLYPEVAAHPKRIVARTQLDERLIWASFLANATASFP